MSAPPTSAAPPPIVGTGFRAVFISPDRHWLLHSSTGEKVDSDISTETMLFEMDEHGQLIIAQKRQVTSGPTFSVAGKPVHVGPAYKLFKLQKLQRPDETYFFMDLNTKETMQPDNTFESRTHLITSASSDAESDELKV